MVKEGRREEWRATVCRENKNAKKNNDGRTTSDDGKREPPRGYCAKQPLC